jgi:putative ABC transport system permease protein
MLLVAAGLLFRSLTSFGKAPLGYSPENVLTMRVDVATRDTIEAKRVFADALERVELIPGVTAAAWTSVVPVEGRGSMESIVVEGRERSARDSVPDVGEQVVSERYFGLMRIPLLAGRGLTHADDASTPSVAVVNRAFVDRFIGGGGAVGRRIRFGGGGATQPWLTIVGVVGNEQRGTVTQEMGWVAPPMVFRPMRQVSASSTMLLVVRQALGTVAGNEQIRRAVRAASRQAVITDVATMRELLDRFLASPRTRAECVAALALLAFTLAVIGLYGMLSQLVVYRTREIGIRVALGARPAEVVGSVVRRGVVLALVGVMIGCLLALPATKAMSALLYGVTTFDPATLFVVGIVMIVTAIFASAFPARRAAAVDPVVALRAE